MEKIVGSKMPAQASDQLRPDQKGYGQNGYGGASSDLPGENTQSGFAKTTDPIRDTLSNPARGKSALQDDSGGKGPVADLQRKAGNSPLPPAKGMHDPNKADEKVPSGGRPVTTRK